MGKELGKHTVWSPASAEIYTQRRIGRARRANRPTLRAFARWLARSRCLAPGTITVRLGSACWFVDAVTARAGNGGPRAAFRRLTAEGLERVFVRYGKGHGLPARRSMQAAMRLFLAFAAERGWVGHELFAAVPSLRTYRLSGLPRGLEDEQIGAVLAAPWEGECPLRDRAIVFLLATYGARRGQVSALRLVDIDWRERTVEFAAHKAGKAVRHSLTPAAAHAVAEYLRRERPTTDCEHVFVRHRHPHVRLSPVAISALVRARTMRCGLPPRHPHAFRHAFATRLLRCGQPLKVIADLLGHRSLEAVSIYAKVDYAQLLACAVEWPEVTP